MLRRDHPVLTFNQIEGLEQFYVSEPVDEIESTVKDARSEMNADQLMNSFETFQDLVLFLDERSHYCRAEGLDQYGNPQHGSTLVAGYLHEGAKNFRDKWGLEMRHRAYTFVKDKWVCHKPGFPIGVEVGEFSEDYTFAVRQEFSQPPWGLECRGRLISDSVRTVNGYRTGRLFGSKNSKLAGGWILYEP